MDCGKIQELDLSDRLFSCCGKQEDRDVHAAINMVKIFEMIRSSGLKIPLGQRKFTRAEFLKAYTKKFGHEYGTLKPEDHTL